MMVQKRGRKSAEDLALTVVEPNPVHVVPRPKPPLDLTSEESDVWRATVDALPADWFRAETHPLLVQWCRHTVTARRVAQLIDNAMAREEIDQTEIKELLGMQAKESSTIKALAASMRISQQASYSARGAGGQKSRRAKTKRLWD